MLRYKLQDTLRRVACNHTSLATLLANVAQIEPGSAFRNNCGGNAASDF